MAACWSSTLALFGWAKAPSGWGASDSFTFWKHHFPDPPPPTKSGKVRLEVEWEESAPGFPALSCERRLFPPPTHSLSLRAALETPILQESVQTERASELGLDGIRVAEMLLSHFWSLGIPGETRCLASESIIGA